MKTSSKVLRYVCFAFCCFLSVIVQHTLAETSDAPAEINSLKKPAISVSRGKYSDFYHILLTLRPSMFELGRPDLRKSGPDESGIYQFSEDGQFEISIHKDQFPILAPKCREYIILRMPATNPSSPGAAAKVSAKKKLFEMIRSLKESGKGQIDVAVELNPYVRVISSKPLQLELTQCNVFFRQAADAYVDYVGPIKRK